MFHRHDVVDWMLADRQTRAAALTARHLADIRALEGRPSLFTGALERARALATRIVSPPAVEPACCPA